MFGASAFIERRVRRARFDQALIDDEHPTPGARATRRARNRRESRRRESRIIRRRQRISTTDATRDALANTPAYATAQLAEMASALTGDDARDACEHLTRRAEHASPYVQRKALRLIAKCCEGGERRSTTFAREMAKLSSRVRALQTATGAPHPTKGDAPRAAVRDAAKECMAAIFGSERDAGSDAGTRTVGGRAMEGFGDGRDARAVESGAADAYRTTPPRTTKPGTLDAPLGDALKSTPKLRVEASEAKWKPLRPPSPVKKAAAASTSGVGDLLSDFASATPARAETTAQTSAMTSRTSEAFVLDGSEEKRAIDKLCTPSGVRLVPAEADVEDFLRTGSRLNAQGVVVALSERLLTYASGEEGWRGAYRAVNVLERAASTSSHRWLADVFANSSAMDLLDAVANDASTHAQLKHKAKACAEALRRGATPGAASGAAPGAAPAATTDLLAQLGDLSVASPPTAPPTAFVDPLAGLTTDFASAPPSSYVPPTAPMRGPGLEALRDVSPTTDATRVSQTKAFDFVGDLLK